MQKDEAIDMGIWQMFKAGDMVVLVPLLVFSLLIWAVVFEKWWSIKKFKQQLRTTGTKALGLVKDHKFNEAKGLLAHADDIVAKPFLTALESKELSRDLKEGQIRRQLVETEQGMRRFIWILGTIATSAPFIGLFGTVIGIINSFDSIARAGKSGFVVVAADLAEALVATAAGIGVAVVAVLFYNIFQVQLQRTLLEYRHRLEEFVDHL